MVARLTRGLQGINNNRLRFYKNNFINSIFLHGYDK